MKSGFNDPIKMKNGTQTVKSPWDWSAPDYDERSSCFINAGTHYGVGHKNPVGHDGPPKQKVATLPFGRPGTMEVDVVG